MEKDYKEANPELAEKSDELKERIISTIHLADSLLTLALTKSPNDELLSILEDEQLPKLKTIFEIQNQATLRKKSRGHGLSNMNDSYTVESTPKNNAYKINNSITDSSQSSKSFLRQIAGNETYSGRNIISFLGDKFAGDKASQSSSSYLHVNRDSISSIKSIASETAENKIILDETVNPKRPLRPNRNTNNTSSPSTSNHGSRPISHLSGEEFLGPSVSMQQINENDISLRNAESFNFEDDDNNSEAGSNI